MGLLIFYVANEANEASVILFDFTTIWKNGFGMLCHSPASLVEGGGGQGAGGGHGIQPHDDLHKPKVTNRSSPLRHEAECTVPPPDLDVHWTSLHPSFQERRGSRSNLRL